MLFHHRLLAALVFSLACVASALGRNDVGFPDDSLMCPPGWKMYPAEGRCFMAVDGRKNWTMARKNCEDLGGNLATVASLDLFAFLSHLLQSTSYWIGLNDRKKEGDFHWLDATAKPAYFNWGKDEPNNVGNCVYLMGSQRFYWSDFDCNWKLFSVCERWASAKIVQPCEEGSFYYPGDQKCLKIHHQSASWDLARATCKRQGGDLVKVTDAAKNQFILGLVQRLKGTNGMIWIGLNDKGRENNFRWLDETANASFTYWSWGNFNAKPNYAENCFHMSNDEGYKWNDLGCKNRLSFMCEIPNRYVRLLTTLFN